MKKILSLLGMLLVAVAASVHADTVVNISEAPTPTDNSAKVKSVYSDAYGPSAIGVLHNWVGMVGPFEACVYESNANDHLFHCHLDGKDTGGNDVENCIGIGFGDLDVSDCQYLAFDVYADFTQVEGWGSGRFTTQLVSTDKGDSNTFDTRDDGASGDAPSGSWKSYRIPLSKFTENVDLTKVNAVKIVFDKTYEYQIYLDNFRFVSDNDVYTSKLTVSYTADGVSYGPYTCVDGTLAGNAVQYALYLNGGTSAHTKYSSITVSDGELTSSDVYTLQWLCQQMGTENVDMGGATVADNTLPANAFINSTDLKSVTLPSGLTTIGNNAFQSSPLESITFPASVTSIGEYAFGGCRSLAQVNFSENEAVSINASAFARAGSNMAINVGNGAHLTFAGNDCFQNIYSESTRRGIHGNVGPLTIGNNVTFTCGTSENIFNGNFDMTVSVGSNFKIDNFPYCMFNMCDGLTNTSLNALLAGLQEGGKIGNYAFFHDRDVNTMAVAEPNVLYLPATCSSIGMAAFGVSPFKEIHVTRATAPAVEGERWIDGVQYTMAGAYTVDETSGAIICNKEKYGNYMDPFGGVTDPNYTILYFDGDAGTGTNWKSYMYSNGTESATGDLNLPFARLLTKDIKTTNTTYDAYPQQHAIVRLHRTLKTGWNSLCLPFGANYAAYEKGGATIYNAQVFKNALNAASGENFMLAVYRGYYKANNLFRFLKYSDYAAYPIDAFEAIMVRMDASDIAAAKTDGDGLKVFTFRNVDLNYRYTPTGGDNIGYGDPELFNRPRTDNEFDTTTFTWSHNVTATTPAKRFAGDKNKTDLAPFNDGNSDYDDYIFTGNYTQFEGTIDDGIEMSIMTNGGTKSSNDLKTGTEGYAMAFDGDATTKYCADFGNPTWLAYTSPDAAKVTTYSLTTGNDDAYYTTRSPKAWVLEGTNDTGNDPTWTAIDTQTDQTFGGNYVTKVYTVNSATAYKRFRLRITEIQGGTSGTFQLGDFDIKGTVCPVSTNDYFMQHNDGGTFFYQYQAGNRYGIRGFSGWFKYVGTENAGARSIPVQFLDMENGTTEIVNFDANGNELPTFDVYNLNGLRVRTAATTVDDLPRGIYIVNGKKTVVK